MNKTEALMKNLLYEKVAVIHAPMRTLQRLRLWSRRTQLRQKLETAFMKTNSITDAWWNNEGVTKMFAGVLSEHNDR